MPRLKLFNPSVCPPNGFRYVFPQDGWVDHAWDYATWFQQAKDHARANNLREPNVDDLEEQLCLTLPPGWCNYDDPNRPRPNTELDWNDVLRGVDAYSQYVLKGFAQVDKDEADRRALICSRCYLNVNISGCSACRAVADKLASQFNSKYDYALKYCAACKCTLRAKVHFPLDILDREGAEVKQLYPEHCWLNKNGPNYG